MSHRNGRTNYQNGFTLVELLVVVIAISVLVGIASLSVGAASDRRFYSEAERLRVVLQQAADASLFEQQTLGWFYRDEQYELQRLMADNNWQADTRKLFKRFAHNSNTELSIRSSLVKASQEETNSSLQDKHKEEDYEPLILFYSSGEYSPFQIQLEYAGSLPLILSGDGLGRIKLIHSGDVNE